MLVLEDGTYSDWRKHKKISVMCFGPQNNLPEKMRDDAVEGKENPEPD